MARLHPALVCLPLTLIIGLIVFIFNPNTYTSPPHRPRHATPHIAEHKAFTAPSAGLRGGQHTSASDRRVAPGSNFESSLKSSLSTQESSKFVSGSGMDSVEISLTPQHIDWMNGRLRDASLQNVLWWVNVTLPKWALFTSFGPSGMIVLNKLAQMGLLGQVPVVTIDTLHLFPESYAHIDSVERRFGFKAKRCRPVDPSGRELDSAAEFAAEYGADLWKSDPERYGELSKVAPTRRALKELGVLVELTGRRASQGGSRAQLKIVESAFPLIRVNPVAHWSYDQIWQSIRQENVPYNSLHDKGYKSIGDWHSTIPTPSGGNERDGRWFGSNKTECGMHSLKERKSDPEQAVKAASWEDGARQRAGAIGIHTVSSVEELEGYLKRNVGLLIMFYSPFCSHCKKFEPKFNSAVNFLKADGALNKYDVLRVDITAIDMEKLPAPYTVQSTPTFYSRPVSCSNGECLHFTPVPKVRVEQSSALTAWFVTTLENAAAHVKDREGVVQVIPESSA